MANSKINSLLGSIERIGNKLPHPTLLFIWLCFLIVVLSWLLSLLQLSASHPVTGETYQVVNLLSSEGIQKILSQAVSNFTQFAPVGVVLVIMLGVGVAEHSGLMACVLKKLVRVTPQYLLAYVIAFAGVMSSIGADVGYVVLIPIAAMVYYSFGRPPLAGIAVAFAGVSAGFSANLLIGPVDVMLSGLSTEAAGLVDGSVSVAASDNYYFIVVSTVIISLMCGWLSNHFIEPRLADQNTKTTAIEIDEGSDYSLVWVFWFTVVYIVLIAVATLHPQGVLASNGVSSVLLNNLVPLLAIYFALAGYIFARSNGIYDSATSAIEGMENAMQTMAYYIVLMFFAAQFVNYFAWSNIGTILAINGADWLGSLDIATALLLLMIVFAAAFINLFVGSASAKWALLAPVLVPMLMLVGIPPEQTQIAYRVGDSVTNIITPLMPYFGIVLAYAQRYKPDMGLGNIIAMMLPYSISLLIVWGGLVAIWIGIGLPLGP